jgi:hypothetical protein
MNTTLLTLDLAALPQSVQAQVRKAARVGADQPVTLVFPTSDRQFVKILVTVWPRVAAPVRPLKRYYISFGHQLTLAEAQKFASWAEIPGVLIHEVVPIELADEVFAQREAEMPTERTLTGIGMPQWANVPALIQTLA